MTRDEFVTRQRAANHEAKILGTIWLAVFFAILLLGAWLEPHHSTRKEGGIYLVLLFGFLFGNLGLLILMNKRHIRKFGLSCPACGRPLIGVASQITVATGNCGYCGAVVFAPMKTRLPDDAV